MVAMWKRVVLCILVALLLTQSTRAAHDGHAALGAFAAFDSQGTLWAAYREGQHVVVRRSHDNGRSWSAPIKVNTVPEPIAATGEARPKIALGPLGEIYVSWTRPLSKPYTGEIRFARSIDGGKVFEPPVTVHTDRQEITHRFDALVVGEQGRIYLAWIDKRDLEIAKKKGENYPGAAVYVAMSEDRGASFRGDFKLADHGCECCRIALLPLGDGDLLAFWRHVFPGNIRDHALARMSPAGASTQLRRATFDNWEVDGCPHHGPSLAMDARGTLHAVWFTMAPEREGIHYGQLVEGAVDAQREVGTENASHADIAADGTRVVIVWKDLDAQRTTLRAMLSTDSGAHWRELTLAHTEAEADQPRLLKHNGRFYAFWNRQDAPLFVVPVE